MLAMIYNRLVILGAAVAAFFAISYIPETKPAATIYIDDYENISFSLLFDSPKASEDNEGNQVFITIFLPFEIDMNTPIQSPNDILISPLSNGIDYTIFLVVAPANARDIIINIDNIGKLSEENGRAKLEINLTYEYLKPVEKQLFENKMSISGWNYKIILPKRFSETELSLSPTDKILPLDEKTLYYDGNQTGTQKISILMPSMNNTRSTIGILIITFLFGILTLLLEGYEFRNRRLIWVVTAFVVSIAILGVGFYFIVYGSELIIFLAAIAFSLPHAVISFIVTMYLLLAKNFEARIFGKITLDGQPLNFANVTLQIKLNPQKIKYKYINRLNGGEYIFYVWLWKPGSKYKISVEATDTTPHPGRLANILPGKPYPQATINLITIQHPGAP